MAGSKTHTTSRPAPGWPSRGLTGARRWSGVLLGLLLVWVALPLVPEETGLKFGLGYQVFFTSMLFLGALFFWFLGKENMPYPRSQAGALGSMAAVYLITVGMLVAVGVVYPQFPRPQPPGAAAQEAAQRGKELFWGSNVGCFRCHTIAGTGGTRGPDLTAMASRAGERVGSLTAEEYLLEKVKAGATYQFKVAGYSPMMPAFGQTLTEEQLNDLVAYLLTLE